MHRQGPLIVLSQYRSNKNAAFQDRRCEILVITMLMKRNLIRCAISMVLLTSCSELPNTPAAATAAAPTPTPENYGLYTDTDLQIYADTIDQRIQQALKNSDTNQAQVLGLKRQELIAEFNRRGLKRKPTEPTVRPHHLHPFHRPQTPTGTGTGLPGQE